jgi:hypothetical protein
MNERIKLLAEQATSIVESPPNREGWTSSYAHFDKEKFAELIVKECIEQVITGPNGPAHYAVEAAIRLKKHFGVEE